MNCPIISLHLGKQELAAAGKRREEKAQRVRKTDTFKNEGWHFKIKIQTRKEFIELIFIT